MTINDLLEQSHKTALEKGWWDQERPFGDQVANMHSELTEAWEEYRMYGLDESWFLYDDENLEKPLGIATEFADVIIRICDTCQKYKIPLEEGIKAKMSYNKTRPYRHGNKKA